MITVYSFKKSERLDMCFVNCEGEDLFCTTWAQLYLQKRKGKNEHEKIALVLNWNTVSQDADNADQKVKWFLEVH